MKTTLDERLTAAKLEMFEWFLDCYVDCFGIDNAILRLLDNDFDREMLLACEFEAADIDAAIAADSET